MPADLRAVILAWPNLSENDRRAVLAIVAAWSGLPEVVE